MSTHDLKQNSAYRTLVAVGLVCYGVVHAVIAWIALQLAWGGGRGDASSGGALRELGQQPLGSVGLWVVAVGMFALVVWQGLEAAFGHLAREGRDRLRKRVSSAGRAVVYLLLGISAAKAALGSPERSGDRVEESTTSRLLDAPFGRGLVVLLGLAVIGVGVALLVKGVRRKFTEDLTGGVSQTVVRLGVAGYVAKGVALAVVGVLFCWAAAAYDADKAGGLDAALKTIRDQPFGSALLTVMAAGILAFGLFCFSWARNARH
jgi:hypothetical protein